MMKMRKTIAYLLAALTIATSADFGVLATAKAEERQLQDAEPAMKFIESGFDEASSVLSMDLMIKPQSTTEGLAPNEFICVSDGAFAISYDSQKLILMTDPAIYNEKGGAVQQYAPEQLTTDSNMLVVGGVVESSTLRALVNAAGNDNTYSGRAINNGLGLSNIMGCYEYLNEYNGTMSEQQRYRVGDFGGGRISSNGVSALLVSTSRDRGNYADAYIQFRYNYGTNVVPKHDGYIRVITLKFLLTSGYDPVLEQPILSHSKDVLYKNSITVPKDAAEAEERLGEFYYNDSLDNSRVGLTIGAAAFKELKTTMVNGSPSNSTPPELDTVTHYYGAPAATKWSNEYFPSLPALSSWESTGGSTTNSLSGGPLVEYTNCDREFIVEQFYGEYSNTYARNESADFVIPENESGTSLYPRYSVSRADDEDAWDAGDENDPNRWVPWRYQYHTSGSNTVFDYKKKQPLKYDLGTLVSSASTNKPETMPDGGLEQFLASIEWDFTLDARNHSILDSEFITSFEEVDAPFMIPTQQGDAQVQKLRVTGPINDPRTPSNENPYRNKLFQKVTYYPGEEGEYVKYTPLGVTFDMVESDISITDINGEYIDLRPMEEQLANPDGPRLNPQGMAPQLNIRSYAADATNILWVNVGNLTAQPMGNGTLYFSAAYKDSYTGDTYPAANTYFRMQLYKELYAASEIAIDLSGLGTTFNPVIEETVTGLTLAKDPVTQVVTDKIATRQAPITAVVYDQYGLPFESASQRPALSLEWVDDPEADPGKRKALPIVVNEIANDVDKYELVYAGGANGGKTVNDVQRGNYVVNATLGTLSTHGEPHEGRSFYINKEANRLTYMNVSLPGIPVDVANGFKEVDFTVRGYDAGRQIPVTNSLQVSVSELANQWRDTNNVWQMNKINEYDVVHGMRNIVNNTDPANPVYSNSIDYDLAYINGVAIEMKLRVASDSPYQRWTGVGVRDGGEIVEGSTENLAADGYWHLRPDPTTDALEITYDTRVGSGMILELIVTAEYNDTTLESKYRLKFNRLTPILHSISLPTVTSVEVPTVTPQQRTIAPVAYDQYGTVMTWASLYTNGNTRYFLEYTPANIVDVAGTGITTSYSGGLTTMSVDKTAKNVQLHVRTRITTNGILNNTIMSNSIILAIARATSIPSSIDAPYYRYQGSPWSPPTNEAGQPSYNEYTVTNLATMIHDQYGEVMSPEDCGTVEWSITGTTGDLKRDELEINPTTGAIRVLRNAHNGKATVRLRIHDKTGVLRVDSKSDYTDYITVQRAASKMLEIEITPNPTTDAELPDFTLPYKQTITLLATGTDQYGDDIVVPFGTASWQIVAGSVEFENPSITSRIGGTIAQPTVYAVDNGIETPVMTFSSGGTLQFSNITKLDYVPKKMRVEVFAGGGSVTDTGDFDIIFKPESQPTTIFVDQTAIDNSPLTIPDAGSSAVVTKEITGDIRNQYGIILPDASIEWSLKEIRYADGTGMHTDPSVPYVTFEQLSNGNAKISLSNTNSDAKNSEIVIVAAFRTSPGSEPILTREVVVNASKGNEVPARIEILDASTIAGINKVYLQGFNSTEVNTVTLRSRIYSNYNDIMAGTTNWAIENIYYEDNENGGAKEFYTGTANIAEFSAGTRNTLMVKQSQDIIDNAVKGNQSFITVSATVAGNPAVKITKDIEIVLASPQPVYSDIKLSNIQPKEYLGLPDDDGVGSLTQNAPSPNQLVTAPWVYLPARRETNSIDISGKVYDQYKREITPYGEAGANPAVELNDDKVDITFRWSTVAGYTFTKTAPGKATLTIGSSIPSGYSTPSFRTTPLNNTTRPGTDVAFTPSIWMTVIRSTDIPDALYYFESPTGTNSMIEDLSNNAYEVSIPQWDVLPEENVPKSLSGVPLTGDMIMEKYNDSVTARILNQYGSEYYPAILMPRWSLINGTDNGMYNGFSLVNASGTNQGTALNQNVFVKVNNKTLGVNEYLREVEITASAKGVVTANRYEDYQLYPEMRKTAKILLSKGRSIPSYLFVKGVDNAGKTQSLRRPHILSDGKTPGSIKTSIEPQIYDQYGYIVGGAEETTVDLITDSVVNQGAAVEEIIEIGGTRQDPIEIVTGYKIYDSELPAPEEPGKKVEDTRILLAEYTIESKELTVYSTCTLNEFKFFAEANGDGSSGILPKEVSIPIDNSEPIRPYRIELEGVNPRVFTIKDNDRTEQQEFVATYLYDQYGNRIDPTNVNVTWKLKIKDSTGNYVDYHEYENDPDTGIEKEKLMEEYLVILAHGAQESPQPAAASRFTIIKVRPEFYEKDIELALEATVSPRSGTYTPRVSVMNTIQIKREKKGGGDPPPLPPPAYYQVTFSGGEYGITVGKNFETVLGGEMVKNTPGIKNEGGWAFDGWSVLGEKIKLDEYPVLDNIEMVATYRSIKQFAFIEGYGDSTVRPGAQVTRAEFIKMIAVALGDYDPNMNYIDMYGRQFSDVPNNAWYANYIAYGSHRGFFGGYEDGTFRPNNPIRRDEASKIIYLAIPELVSSVEKGDLDIDEIFSDIEYGDWFAEYVEALYYLKIIGGYEDATFRPANHVSRAEAVKMIVLITEIAPTNEDLSRIKQYIDSPFSDLKKDSWAYAYVLRAAGIA